MNPNHKTITNLKGWRLGTRGAWPQKTPSTGTDTLALPLTLEPWIYELRLDAMMGCVQTRRANNLDIHARLSISSPDA
jgi:hypothetical protein